MLYWMYLYTGLFGFTLTRSFQPIFKMLPYLATMFVLILTSIRKKKENQPPANLGLPYFREER
ncbi:MAG: ABC transporter permease, partial [Clostridia bacterium]|nr:ABC transporter permease [Clostridia bacterium]